MKKKTIKAWIAVDLEKKWIQGYVFSKKPPKREINFLNDVGNYKFYRCEITYPHK